MKRMIGVLVAALWCGASSTAQAQFGIGDVVYDPTNWIQNLETAIQTTETAINTAEIIANQVLDLTAHEAWRLGAGTWVADLQQIQALVLQAEGLAWDVARLNAQITSLFGLESAPMTSLEFRERQAEIRGYLYQSWSYAMRTQTLIQTLLATVEHILGIYESLTGLIGNKQGLQSLGQYQAKASQTL